MAQPIVSTREAQEEVGGCWLPLYIIGATISDPAEIHHCFYCGYGVTEGHDYDCLFLNHPVRQKFSGKYTIIFVPKGGLK